MPDELHATVRARTDLPDLYRRSAAHQSMSHYLADWEKAYEVLGRRIAVLRSLRDERQAEQSSGVWPYPNPLGSGESGTPPR